MIRLYVGGDATSVQGRPCHLTGYRCFTAAHQPRTRFPAALVPNVVGLLDSGAFSDAPARRLTAAGALNRQLRWEATASRHWHAPWTAESVVSYDLLIDEKWTGQHRTKQRWSAADGDAAVRVTVDAAGYLASQRDRLAPRRLVLACQGVDAIQYAECVAGVLEYATPADWIGLGGWCILGWHRSWLPTFWAAMRSVLPRIIAAGVRHVHIFGVMYRPALGGLLWLADQHGLSVSTDSSGPLLRGRYTDPAARKKAGQLADTWEENVYLFQEQMRTLRSTRFYHEPPVGRAHRQLTLF